MHLTSEAEGRTEDVPGAILTREKTEEWTVKQLQRWLLCRGAGILIIIIIITV